MYADLRGHVLQGIRALGLLLLTHLTCSSLQMEAKFLFRLKINEHGEVKTLTFLTIKLVFTHLYHSWREKPTIVHFSLHDFCDFPTASERRMFSEYLQPFSAGTQRRCESEQCTQIVFVEDMLFACNAKVLSHRN